MKATATSATLRFWQADGKLQPELTLTLIDHPEQLQSGLSPLIAAIDKGRKLSVTVEPEKRRRSLNANAYMWVLLDKLARVLNTDKDSLYIEMLDRYGVFTHIIVKPEVVDRVKAEWRTVRDLGEVTINGKTGIQLQCYFGSSTFSTAEMARLIDGVVSECAEVGVETLPPAEIEAIKNLWEGNNGDI
jgi:hypothetical protein